MTRHTFCGLVVPFLVVAGSTAGCAPGPRAVPQTDVTRTPFTFTLQAVPAGELPHRRVEARSARGVVEVVGSVATSCGTEHIGVRYTSTSGSTGRPVGEDSVLSTLFVNIATFTSSEICLNVGADFRYHAITRVGSPGRYQVRVVHQYLRNEPRVMLDTVVRVQ